MERKKETVFNGLLKPFKNLTNNLTLCSSGRPRNAILRILFRLFANIQVLNAVLWCKQLYIWYVHIKFNSGKTSQLAKEIPKKSKISTKYYRDPDHRNTSWASRQTFMPNSISSFGLENQIKKGRILSIYGNTDKIQPYFDTKNNLEWPDFKKDQVSKKRQNES